MIFNKKSGPEGIRTLDLQLRRLSLFLFQAAVKLLRISKLSYWSIFMCAKPASLCLIKGSGAKALGAA